MARIGGVGAKKLESYGRAFLEVIAGEAEDTHPARRKLAGKTSGTLYDRLLAVQSDLTRGPDGTGKPMTLSASVIAKIAEARPTDLSGLSRLLGDRHAERFGAAFLDVLQDG
jgi:ATP-dependent DNA helicase RecQ